MGCRILSSPSACLYDSVTGWAFGPILDDEEDAENFLIFLKEKTETDPRMMSDQELGDYYSAYLRIKNND